MKKTRRSPKRAEPNVIVDLELHLTTHIIQHFAFRDECPLSKWQGAEDLVRVASHAALYLVSRQPLRMGIVAWAADNGGELSISVSATGDFPYLTLKIACPIDIATRVIPTNHVSHVLCALRMPVRAAGYIPEQSLRPSRGTVRDAYPKGWDHVDVHRRLTLQTRQTVRSANAARSVAGLPLLRTSHREEGRA